ncbi:MAG: hypothetical protein AAGA58_12390 [Verrucomicrobiota bacterium]
MITGTSTTKKTPEEAMERLRTILAGANCRVISDSDEHIEFRHGTYLTHSSPLLPKTATVRFIPTNDGTQLEYSVTIDPFPKYWLGGIGILLCWLIFPAVLAYRALKVHPREMMENFLAGV